LQLIPNQKEFYTNDWLLTLNQIELSELDIYHQAFLEQSSPFILSQNLHSKTTNEMGVRFHLVGEIKGEVICLLDLYDKKTKTASANFLKALFVESMNILLGQMMTQVQSKAKKKLILSHPHFLEKMSALNFQNTDSAMSTGYKLITAHEEYDCRIIIQLEKDNK
tara:strand:+ start:15790 stop:16284 length:495 start_codon:yes stop_codon:yes gene_type:complete